MLGAVPCLALAGLAPASGATAAGAGAAQAGPMHSRIVLLRNQNRGLGARSNVRRTAVRTQQAPIISQLRASGATHISSISLINAVSANMTNAEASDLRANPAVAKVISNSVIPEPSLPPPGPIAARAGHHARQATVSPPPCGTASSPEIDPEALTNINALSAQNMGYTGAGVKVAYIADGIDPTNSDLQRNAAYASAGSATGTPVLNQYDFSGDGPGQPTAGGEAFLDASSIAAQGNTVYDLSNFVSTAHPLPAGCDIKIVGAAPGASVMGLDVFSTFHDTTEANFLQAISFAVANGANVINESFGSNNFPDTAADATRLADDAAIAAGVTVVVSSGDAGVTSTQGSPATDPNVIDVGATTSFRSYAQSSYGGINDPNSNGNWVSNNISSLSSGGFAQSNGRTVDLVAPGDLNFALCNPNKALFFDCSNENGQGSPIELSGGTSESSPLTAGAAADVIQAYARTHGGAMPSPELVKQILTSTASDIGAPASEQGAGLLNVGAAVQEAASLPGTSTTPDAGLLVSPGQINVTQRPDETSRNDLTLTNTGSSKLHVDLSTRSLSHVVGDRSGSFCLQPGTPTASCPANTGVFPIWSGVAEVYQDVNFTVPSTSKLSRLVFTADYQYTGQNSLLHVALLEPDGTYAGYSLPQGLADYARIEVAHPPPGTWTAVFFTAQNAAHLQGTTGTIQWDASTMTYTHAGRIEPESLVIPAGGSTTADLSVTSPHGAGDSDQSLVLATPRGTTTVPVTVRTLVPTHHDDGGNFAGVLTGGNGRSAPSETNTYQFHVSRGQSDLDVGLTLANDPQDVAIAFLVDPNGQTLGYSSNVTADSNNHQALSTTLNLYHASPQPGLWSVIIDWYNPVSGLELTEPFTERSASTRYVFAEQVHCRTAATTWWPATRITLRSAYEILVSHPKRSSPTPD